MGGALGCDAPHRAAEPTLEQVLAADWSTFGYEVVGPMPEDRQGGVTVVFLHGYGSRGAHHRPLAEALVDEETRVVLPTSVVPHPRGEGAMWWEFIDEDWPRPYSDDPTANAWPKPSRQLPRASGAVVDLVERVRARYRPDVLVIAGHSQGAMLALDVSTALDPPADRLVLLSGYLLLDTMPRLEARRDERPDVLIVHGRKDEIVPFERAVLLRDVLEANGYPVTFAPFDGGHSVDAGVIRVVEGHLDR